MRACCSGDNIHAGDYRNSFRTFNTFPYPYIYSHTDDFANA